MPDVEPYAVSYSFTGWQSANPSRPLPGAAVDSELYRIAGFSVDIATALRDVRRADGALQNSVVTLDSLSTAVRRLMGLSVPGEGIGAGELSAESFATQAAAEEGVANDVVMTPLRTAQAVAAHRPFAAAEQSNTTVENVVMSPARTREAIEGRRPAADQTQAEQGTSGGWYMTALRTQQAIAFQRPAFSATSALTWGELAAAASAAQEVAVPGAAVGDRVSVALPAAGVPAGVIVTAWVSAADTVTVRMTNISAGALTPTAGSYAVSAQRF